MRFSGFILIFLAFISVAAFAQISPPPPRPAAEGRSLVLSGGCFWCLEEPFEDVQGVIRVETGYAGGTYNNPTYRDVASGITGHMESIRIIYDPAQITFARLLDIYWRNIDPFDTLGQFCDKGDQYKTAIFIDGPVERQIAEKSRAILRNYFGRPIATEIRNIKDTNFYPAEPEHQDYYKHKSRRYKLYRKSCKRDKKLMEIWGQDAGGARFKVITPAADQTAPPEK